MSKRATVRRSAGVVASAAALAVCAGGVLAMAGAVTERGAMLRAARSATEGVHLPAGALEALKRAERLPGMGPGAAEFHSWLEGSGLCFKYPETPAEWDEVVNVFQGRPPNLDPWYDPGLEFATSSSVWVGDVSLGTSQRAQPARLTISFPADGVTWGDGGTFGSAPNNLSEKLGPLYGTNNLDRARELIRAAFANYRRNSGLTYDEVADTGAAYTTSTTRSPNHGDIRIGGHGLSSSSVLAYNQFPSSGGDMVINTNSLSGGTLANTFSQFLNLRNVIAHEHGHGTGYIHQVPCNQTKLMEPFIFANDLAPMQNHDDVRGAQRNYGDRFAGNTTAANARDFGDLTVPSVRSVIERDLSTNGASGFSSTSTDWFRFTLSSEQTVTITVQPTGSSVTMGNQSSDCNGTTTTVNSLEAGNLQLELRDAVGSSAFLASSNNAIGLAETITMTLPAATYTIRLRQQSDGPAANQILQLYDLTIRVGTSNAPPQAIAGINKRCAANTNCWFLASLNSRATETGEVITGYQWDLDGDGVFDATAGNTSTQYSASGVYPVTLVATDSNGMTDTDTINVTVFGGVTAVTAAVPDNGVQGQTVPITITGTNLKTVTSAAQVQVSGTGVAVVGTPVSNVRGTQLTGLSLQIDGAAPAGPRDITITSSGSVGTGVGEFTVVAAPTCTLDYNGDTVVNPDDLGDFITDYYSEPAIPGPEGYAIPCPENAPPYDLGYKAGFVPGGAGQCIPPFSDNLGDWITQYFGDQTCG